MIVQVVCYFVVEEVLDLCFGYCVFVGEYGVVDDVFCIEFGEGGFYDFFGSGLD